MSRRSTGGATLDDVAREAGVSPQTASRTLRAPELVAEATRARVEAAMQSIGYVRNLAASGLAAGRSRTVAAVLPAIDTSVFAEMLQGLESVLAPDGFQLFLGATGYAAEAEERLVRALLGRRPDGVVMVGTCHSATTRALLHRAGVPVVQTWELADDPVDSLVGFSNAEPIRRLQALLRADGRRRQVFAGMRPGDTRAAARRDAFVGPVVELEGPSSLASGGELLHAVLREHPDADAVLFPSDVLAAGAVLTAGRTGIDVPGAVAVTGFGDFEIAAQLHPSLTTVAVGAYGIGRTAAEVLLARMAGGRPQRIDVGFEIVRRESA